MRRDPNRPAVSWAARISATDTPYDLYKEVYQDTSGDPDGHPVTEWSGDIPSHVRVSKFRTSLRQLSGCD